MSKSSRKRTKGLKASAVLLAVALGAGGAVLGISQVKRDATPTVSDQVESYYEAHKDLTGNTKPTAATTSPAAAEPVRPLDIHRPADRPLRVLFAGDSLTGSYFASTEAKGFRPLLVSSLAAKGPVDPIGVGVPHGRLSEVEAGTDVPANADLAIIEVGTNDFGKTPVQDFRTQYDALLQAVKAKSPDVKFVCMGLWRGGNESNNGIPGKDYDSAVKGSCEAMSGSFVALAPIYDGAGNRGPEGVKTWIGMSDTFHPNDKGHDAIKQLALSALKIS